MLEYKLNKYITVKLENDNTVLYINDEEFIECKRLVLQIPGNLINKYEPIESIDEARDFYKKTLIDGKVFEGLQDVKPPISVLISPEEEFWGHCSNLQAWIEFNYDTSILSSNLSFPLLKRLTEVGDSVAKKVFKEEIAKRYREGNENARKYLRLEGYLKYLSTDDLLSLVEPLSEQSALIRAKDLIERKIIQIEIRNGKVVKIIVSRKGLGEYNGFSPIIKELHSLNNIIDVRSNKEKLPKWFDAFQALEIVEFNAFVTVHGENYEVEVDHEILELRGKKIREITEIKGLEKIIYLKWLDLSNNEIVEIKGLNTLTNLEVLYLNKNRITEIKSLEAQSKLVFLNLNHNQISEIKGLDKLTNLEELQLYGNQIKEIKGLTNLRNLQWLTLSNNQIIEIKGLDTLLNLRYLFLTSNQIIKINDLNKLTKLKWLLLPNNQIAKIEGLSSLNKLHRLNLSQNKIVEIKDLESLTNLRELDLSRNNISEIKKLGNLINLKHLNLDYNPIQQEEIHLLKKKVKEIIDYCKKK